MSVLAVASPLPERIALAWMLRTVPRDDAVTAALGSVDDDIDVWLVVGNDDRALVPDQPRDEYGTLAGRRADLIMLVAVDPRRDEIRVLSIPRDLRIDTDRFGPLLLTETFGYGGTVLLVESITALTGLVVEHYIEWSFDGFVRVVDSLDGLDVELCSPIRDEFVGIDLPEGRVHLDGERVLSLARSRAPERYVDGAWVPGRQGDRERMARQLVLVAELTDRARSGLDDMLRLGRTATDAIVVDDRVGHGAVARLLRVAEVGTIRTDRLGATPIRSQVDRRSPFGSGHLGGRLYLQPAVDVLPSLRWLAGVESPSGRADPPTTAPGTTAPQAAPSSVPVDDGPADCL